MAIHPSIRGISSLAAGGSSAGPKKSDATSKNALATRIPQFLLTKQAIDFIAYSVATSVPTSNFSLMGHSKLFIQGRTALLPHRDAWSSVGRKISFGPIRL